MQENWTGRLEFEVRSPRAQAHLGMVELIVRIDEVAIFYVGRSMAVFDRVGLRRWLSNPGVPWTVDDITFSTQGRTLLMALDQAPPMPVPASVASRLKALT